MKKSIQILHVALVLVLTSVIFTSCVDKDYDDLVTANVDPNLTATHTIKQLQSFATGSTPVKITSDIIVAGVVAGDDSSGNIYKKIILQQDSSGIAIQVDVSNFYTQYPVGRHVYVKCKGLYIANNGGNIELGISSTNPVGRIPANLVSQYLVKGKWGQYITPKSYLLSDPNIPTNTLVKFNDVEFASGDAGSAYAAVSPANLTLEDCAATPNTLVLYSSTYASFALTKTPTGKGSIVGVFTVYGGAGELQIRDLKDVNMTALRCDGSTGIPTLTTLDSIRALDPGAGNLVYLPHNKKINVTITSNYSTAMLTGKNAYAQDGTAGIQLRFTAAHSFAQGTLLEINVSGLELSTFGGVLQINNIPLGNAIPIGSGSVTPRLVTIADINANYNTWEAQVVRVNHLLISGTGTTYGGNKTLNDGTGTITLFTTTGSSSAPPATFANDPYPTDTVSIIGILTEYNGTKEILLRDDVNDVIH